MFAALICFVPNQSNLPVPTIQLAREFATIVVDSRGGQGDGWVVTKYRDGPPGAVSPAAEAVFLAELEKSEDCLVCLGTGPGSPRVFRKDGDIAQTVRQFFTAPTAGVNDPPE